MRIDPPDLNSRRCRFADWLELSTLASASGRLPVAAVRNLLRVLEDDRMLLTDLDPDAVEVGEPEITDGVQDELVERVTDELQFRARTIDTSYPFELVPSDGLGLSYALARRDSLADPVSGELFYTFCLLDSGIRDGLLILNRSEKPLEQRIGNVFQICSCLAVGGYLSAHVISFGFPRARGDGFLPALQAAWRRYGSYNVRRDIPHGFDDRLKDGGVDIIAWRPFDDGQAASVLMFAQVASGLDWKDKEVSGDVRAIRQWFEGARFEHFLPAICIPFPLWFDLDEPPKDLAGITKDFAQGILLRFISREAKFGVIFDRGRIARSCARALGSPEGQRLHIDGADRVGEVAAWVNEIMAMLSEKRAAA